MGARPGPGPVTRPTQLRKGHWRRRSAPAIVERMPRSPRDTAAGTLHVWAHAVRSDPLFRDAADRMTFLRDLVVATVKAHWTCIGFSLLTTHYHLVLEVADGALPRGMHALNSRYAAGVNGRHALKGHAFAARYGYRRVVGESDLLTAFRYVARNPVEAGLCSDASQWPWSSYGAAVGTMPALAFVDPSRVLGCFDSRREFAVAQLRVFVEKP